METKVKLRLLVSNVKFLSTTAFGTVTVSVGCTFAPPAAQVALLGTMLSTLTGLFLSYLDHEELREKRRNEILKHLGVPLSLANERNLLEAYTSITGSLQKLSQQKDPTLRQCALSQLASLASDVHSLSVGTVVFSSTETWRALYEELLSGDLESYFSVSWVKTKDYWQDVPGKQSMDLNYEFVSRGKRLERIFILRDRLWPKNAALPTKEILPWITEQHERGIHISLVRESDLTLDTELLSDFGIYEKRATGVQELDDHSRTVRFTISFDEKSIDLARDRFERISLYAVDFKGLLDKSTSTAYDQ